MKKILLTTVVIFWGLIASAQDYTVSASAEISTNTTLEESSVEPSTVGWSYGSCSFDGKRPSKSFSFGSLQIYHNGSVKKTGTRGTKQIWSGDGDVCVVYIRKQDIGNQIFKINGSVQECTKMAK